MSDNELIAEFMGGRRIGYGQESGYRGLPVPPNLVIIETTCHKYLDELRYNTSWDWLMPVVEKIEGMELVKSFDITGSSAWLSMYRVSLDVGNMNFMNMSESGKIDAVYKTVIEFIKWYNQQNNENT